MCIFINLLFYNIYNEKKHIVYHLLYGICYCINKPTGTGSIIDWLEEPRQVGPYGFQHRSLKSFKLQKVYPNKFKVTNHVFSTEEFNLNEFRFNFSNISEAITKISTIIGKLKVLKTREESYKELNTLLFSFVNDNNMYHKWKEPEPTEIPFNW